MGIIKMSYMKKQILDNVFRDLKVLHYFYEQRYGVSQPKQQPFIQRRKNK